MSTCRTGQRRRIACCTAFFQYLAGTCDTILVLCIRVGDASQVSSKLMTDSDHAGCSETRRSRSGWCHFIHGSHDMNCGALVDWGSKRQPSTALSPPAAETIATVEGLVKTGLVVSGILDDVYGRLVPMSVECDCDPARQNILNGGGLGGLKHVAKHPGVRVGFLRDLFVQNHELSLPRVDTTCNTADIFTKPLDLQTFTRYKAGLGLVSMSSVGESRKSRGGQL